MHFRKPKKLLRPDDDDVERLQLEAITWLAEHPELTVLLADEDCDDSSEPHHAKSELTNSERAPGTDNGTDRPAVNT